MHKPFLNINACFPCQGTILHWKSWKYLFSNTRWCIKAYVCRGTCSFPVSGSSGVVLQGKTTEFPKTILFWESCGQASVLVPVCILKLGNFQGTDRVMRGHLVYTFEKCILLEWLSLPELWSILRMQNEEKDDFWWPWFFEDSNLYPESTWNGYP